jgi:hypothetical protein
MSTGYNYAAFVALRNVSSALLKRTGDLMLDVVTGTLDLDTLQDMLKGARARQDTREGLALSLLIEALKEMQHERKK